MGSGRGESRVSTWPHEDQASPPTPPPLPGVPDYYFGACRTADYYFGGNLLHLRLPSQGWEDCPGAERSCPSPCSLMPQRAPAPAVHIPALPGSWGCV